MSAIASQITSLTIVCSTDYSDADQRKHQSSASLAFVRGIHRWPMNSPHKGSVTRRMFPFDDVTMLCIHWTLQKYLLLTKFSSTFNEFSAWVSNHIHVKVCGVITHPCPNFNSGLTKQSLKLEHTWVTTSNCFYIDLITKPGTDPDAALVDICW